MKKENTVSRRLRSPIIVCGRVVKEIWFDLNHINYGWDHQRKDYNQGSPRSHFVEEDVVAFFEQLEFIDQLPAEQEVQLSSVEKRFVFFVFEKGKKLKMVIDFMKNSITVVVTIY